VCAQEDVAELIGARPFQQQTTYEEFVYGAEGLPTGPQAAQPPQSESSVQPSPA